MTTIPIGTCQLVLKQGDITKEAVDAIVNAANTALAPGGGVCGAIHRAAGPELAAACARLDGCETGMAVITPGFQLPARFVIHTVGPVYAEHLPHEAARLLSSCYRASLHIAAKKGLNSIAFPSISTGIFGYPVPEAAEVALATIRNFLLIHGQPGRVVMVLFSENDLAAYQAAWHRVSENGGA